MKIESESDLLNVQVVLAEKGARNCAGHKGISLVREIFFEQSARNSLHYLRSISVNSLPRSNPIDYGLSLDGNNLAYVEFLAESELFSPSFSGSY